MKTILLALIFAAPQISSTRQLPAEVDLCKLVAASSEYNGKSADGRRRVVSQRSLYCAVQPSMRAKGRLGRINAGCSA